MSQCLGSLLFVCLFVFINRLHPVHTCWSVHFRNSVNSGLCMISIQSELCGQRALGVQYDLFAFDYLKPKSHSLRLFNSAKPNAEQSIHTWEVASSSHTLKISWLKLRYNLICQVNMLFHFPSVAPS